MDSHPRPPRAVGDVRIGAEDPRGARRPALEPLQALHEGRLSGPVTALDRVIAAIAIQNIRPLASHDRRIFIDRIVNVVRGRDRRVDTGVIQQTAVRDRPVILLRDIFALIALAAAR